MAERRRYESTKQKPTAQVASNLNVQPKKTNLALGLASALDAASPAMQQWAEKHQEGERRAGKIAAIRDQVKSSTDSGEWQAPQAPQGKSDAWRESYLSTSWSIDATDTAADISREIEDNLNDPDFDPEEYADRRANQILMELDDDAVDVYGPKLLTLLEDTKTKAFEKRQQMLQREAEVKIGQLATDYVDNGVMATTEGLNAFLTQAENLEIPKESAMQLAVSRMGEQAIESKNPELMDVFQQDIGGGYVPVNDPKARKAIKQLQAKAKTAKDDAFSMADTQVKQSIYSKADAGTLSYSDLQRTREVLSPGDSFITEGNFANLMRQSERNHQRMMEKAQDESVSFSAWDQGLLGLRRSRTMSPKDQNEFLRQALNREIEMAASNGADNPTAEGTDAFLTKMNKNGGLVSKDIQSTLLAGGTVSYAPGDNEIPQAFKSGYQMYIQLKDKYPQVLDSHLGPLDDTVETAYEQYEEFLEYGYDDQQAFAMTQKLRHDAPLPEEFRKSDTARKIRDRAIKAAKSYDIPGQLSSRYKDLAMDMGRLGLSTERAMEVAASRIKRSFKPINGFPVYTGGNPLPPKTDEAVQWYLGRQDVLDSISQSLGTNPDDIKVKRDLFVQPLLGDSEWLRPEDKGRGANAVLTPFFGKDTGIPIPEVSFNLNKIIDEYMAHQRKTAKEETRQRIEEQQERRRERIEGADEFPTYGSQIPTL